MVNRTISPGGSPMSALRLRRPRDPGVLDKMLARSRTGRPDETAHVLAPGWLPDVGRAAGEGQWRVSRWRFARRGVRGVRPACRIPAATPRPPERPARLANSTQLRRACGCLPAAALDSRDPFGVGTLYDTTHAGSFTSPVNGSTLRDPRLPNRSRRSRFTIPSRLVRTGPEDVPVRGIKRLLPGASRRGKTGALTITPYCALTKTSTRPLADRKAAVRLVRKLGREAVTKR